MLMNDAENNKIGSEVTETQGSQQNQGKASHMSHGHIPGHQSLHPPQAFVEMHGAAAIKGALRVRKTPEV